MLPERFIITIEGKLWNVRQRANMVPNELPHLLGRLIGGGNVAPEAWEGFGLRVTVEVCTDQGDDGVDDLRVR